MEPTPDDWRHFAALLAIIATLGGAVVALRQLGFLRRTTPTDAGSGVVQRLDRHAERLTQLEARVSGLASRDDIHALQLAIERQAGAVTELRTALERDARAVDKLASVVTRIEEFLLGEARR